VFRSVFLIVLPVAVFAQQPSHRTASASISCSRSNGVHDARVSGVATSVATRPERALDGLLARAIARRKRDLNDP